ncbi:HAD hydrolase-like protein [Candidatus Woesearchaeota archaeon]|nr:HAD hydrolase-like protein [Candidatus Woesearchaeota archaeon]
MRICFDVDDTLYKQSDDMREGIMKMICIKAAEASNLSPEEAVERINKVLEETGSHSGAVRSLGIEKPKILIWEALQETDVAPYLSKDERLLNVLYRLKEKGHTLDLLTGREPNSAKKILECLGIPIELFDFVMYSAVKKDSSPFHEWLRATGAKPEQCVYVGDNAAADVHPIKNDEKLSKIKTVLVNREKDPLADFHITEIYEIENLF